MPPLAVLAALSDATRFAIVTLLLDGAKPVHMLAASFDISRPAISRHLRVLKQAGLITEDKKGRENLYRLHLTALAPLRQWLDGLASPAPAVTPPSPAASMTRQAKQSNVSQMGFDF